MYDTAWTVLESDITAANGIAAGADTACRFKILISLTDFMTATGNHTVKLLYKSQDGTVTELVSFQATL